MFSYQVVNLKVLVGLFYFLKDLIPSTIRLGSSLRKDILPIKITGSPSIRKSWTVTSILGKTTVSMLESKSEILTKAIGSPFLVTIFLTVVMMPPIVS